MPRRASPAPPPARECDCCASPAATGALNPAARLDRRAAEDVDIDALLNIGASAERRNATGLALGFALLDAARASFLLPRRCVRRFGAAANALRTLLAYDNEGDLPHSDQASSQPVRDDGGSLVRTKG